VEWVMMMNLARKISVYRKQKPRQRPGLA